jgi:hypothetical protein
MLDSELAKTRVIRPYGNPDSLDTPGPKYINDPYETFVGNNQYLRSTDPSTLIIVNERAANNLTGFLANTRPDLLETGRSGFRAEYFGAGTGLTEPNAKSELFKVVGDFQESDHALLRTRQSPNGDAKVTNNDRGFLSAGVWLNHKAVIQAMLGADTIVTGLTNLLNRMNAATLNYWQLTLDVSEPLPPLACIPGEGTAPPSAFSYSVADMNYRENAQSAVDNFFKDVHVFNKYIRSAGGTLVGSDVLDCSVDINLPKRLFSQISTMGLVQEDDVTVTAGAAPKVGDPNDTLRKMFAITQVGRDANGKSPDLTAPILDRSGVVSGTCGGTVTPLPAGSAGQGTSATPAPAAAAAQDPDDLQKDIDRANSILNAAPCNTTCATEVAAATASPQQAVDINQVPSARGTRRAGVPVLSQLSVGQIQSIQKPLGNVLAVGKYQAIPITFKAWIDSEKIPLDTIFNEATQERLGDWLVGAKRPIVRDFVNGSPDITLERAQLELAKEFASVPVPYTVTRPAGAGGSDDPGRVVQAGQSYYFGVGNNTARPAGGKYRRALQDARNAKNFGPLKRVISSGEGTIDDINTGEAGDTPVYSSRYYQVLTPAGTAPAEPQATPAPTQSLGSSILEGLRAARDFAARAFVEGAAAEQDALSLVRGNNDVTSPITCTDCIRAKRITQQKSTQLAANKELGDQAAAIPRKFPGLEVLFRYIEPFGTLMLANITNDADGNLSNAFGASPGSLSINVELTLPGISGLRVGQLFWLDRIPAFYRAFGAFQIISIEDTIAVDGWKTKISAKFNYMGVAWKDAVSFKLGSSS